MANITSVFGELVDLARDLVDNVTAIAQREPPRRDGAQAAFAETAETLRQLELAVRHREDTTPHASRLRELIERVLEHATEAIPAHRLVHFRNHLGDDALVDLPSQIAADESSALRVIETAASEFAALATGLERTE